MTNEERKAYMHEYYKTYGPMYRATHKKEIRAYRRYYYLKHTERLRAEARERARKKRLSESAE